MKRKIIFGFLMVVLLLFFITSSWALDYKRYKYEGRPEQDCIKVPVIPQSIDSYPSMIKFFFISTAQNLPVLIYIDRSLTQANPRAEDSVKNLTVPINKTR